MSELVAVRVDQSGDSTAKGLGLAFFGGLTLSFDIPMIRLAMSDAYMVMACRGFGLAVVLGLYWRFVANRSAMPAYLFADRDFLTVGALSGVANIAFALAVFNTSAANLVFILAFNALLAALLSWPLAGERPRLHTALAIAATLIGVFIIVADSVDTGNWLGDCLALLCATALALSLVLARRSRKDLSMAPGFAGLVSGCFALPIAAIISPWPEAPGWLAANALILVPIAGATMWLAPRFIAAPTVAIFYLLETVLAPVWVWLVFAEWPGRAVIVGGTIVVAALAAHSLCEMIGRSRRRHNKSNFGSY